MLTKEQLVKITKYKFIEKYKKEPSYYTLTPGRINIIGEHTDYNDGLSMPATIDRWICATISKNTNKVFNFHSLNYNDNLKIISCKVVQSNTVWKRLVSSAINILSRKYNIDIEADILIYGNIPIGCGMSSSTALVISVVKTICHLFNIQLIEKELAKLCQKIENNALGNSSGLLDQYGIIFSKKKEFMLIDFLEDSIEYFSPNLHNCSWVIINSQIQRELSNSAYKDRVVECKQGFKMIKSVYNISSIRYINFKMLNILKDQSNILYRRLYHVMEENNRVLDLKKYLLQGAVEKVGEVLKESHRSLSYLYEVSCSEIDYIIELSEHIEGWYGGRIMGGGFGGCSIHLLNNKSLIKFTNHVTKEFKSMYRINPEFININFA